MFEKKHQWAVLESGFQYVLDSEKLYNCGIFNYDESPDKCFHIITSDKCFQT